MKTEHPITPPPELVQQWCHKWTDADGGLGSYLDTKAARWGADQELEACVKWLKEQRWEALAIHLRAARRPKPPSLKKQALLLCDDYIDPEGIIRRALESLPD